MEPELFSHQPDIRRTREHRIYNLLHIASPFDVI